jgi:hypothetical protein
MREYKMGKTIDAEELIEKLKEKDGHKKSHDKKILH